MVRDPSTRSFRRMPVVSRFHGITAFFNHNDHPPPHFHARHGSDEIIVEIGSGKITGRFPATARQMILAGTMLHKRELLDRWWRARLRVPLPLVSPLP